MKSENWKLKIEKWEYSQLPLRRTRSGPAPTVHLREVSALEGDEVNDWSTTGTNSTCPLYRGVRFNEVSVKRELPVCGNNFSTDFLGALPTHWVTSGRFPTAPKDAVTAGWGCRLPHNTEPHSSSRERDSWSSPRTCRSGWSVSLPTKRSRTLNRNQTAFTLEFLDSWMFPDSSHSGYSDSWRLHYREIRIPRYPDTMFPLSIPDSKVSVFMTNPKSFDSGFMFCV